MLSFWKNYKKNKFIKHLQEPLAQINLKRQSKKYQEIQSLGILVCPESIEDLEHIRAFENTLKQEGKKSKVLVFSNTKETPRSLEFAAFNKKDLNWYDVPSGHHPEQFLAQKFDLLISIHRGDCLPLQYISALSKAHFRIGPQTDIADCYDLNLGENPIEQIDSFIQQVRTFLMVLNNTPYEKIATV